MSSTCRPMPLLEPTITANAACDAMLEEGLKG